MAKIIYVISDTFFGRSSLAKARGFSSSEEMDAVLIKEWNDKVKPDDIIWHLGNFAWDIIAGENALHQLNGNINLIQSELDEGLSEIYQIQNIPLFKGYVIIKSLNIVMSHWPMYDWPAKYENNSMHIHGGDKEYRAQLNIENRFNVNCELWSLHPVSINALNETKDMVK